MGNDQGVKGSSENSLNPLLEQQPDPPIGGYCQYCHDLREYHPDGTCITRPGGFVHGGWFKVMAMTGQEFICDTLYQAKLMAKTYRGHIFDRHGNPVTRR